MNDSVVRLGVLQGEYHWHQHDDEDELFLVLDGHLVIGLPDDTVALGARQATVIPRGVQHRPRAPERTVVVMMEGGGVYSHWRLRRLSGPHASSAHPARGFASPHHGDRSLPGRGELDGIATRVRSLHRGE